MDYKPEEAMMIKLDYELPEYPTFVEGIRRAPHRESHLIQADKELAIKNALRYIHPDHHKQMAKEFAQELEEHGRIYGYRFRPQGEIHGKPIDQYKGNCIEGKAFQVMIDNNLDFDVALYPYELTTYGETGQVCQNWMQYRLIKKYLEVLTDDQTLVVESGHPLGLFKSHKTSPRVIITNGLMIGMFDNQESFNRAAALGVANYGQMTAFSTPDVWCWASRRRATSPASSMSPPALAACPAHRARRPTSRARPRSSPRSTSPAS